MIFHFRSAPASRSNVQTDYSKSVARSRHTCADSSALLYDLIREYGTCLDSLRLATVWMNGHCTSTWEVWIRRKYNISVSTWKRDSGTGVVLEPLFVPAYDPESILRLYSVSDRSTMERRLGHFLLQCETSWWQDFDSNWRGSHSKVYRVLPSSFVWDLLRYSWGLEHPELVKGRNDFANWYNVAVHALSGTVHDPFYSCHPPWWPEYEWCRKLTVPTLLVFSYFCN